MHNCVEVGTGPGMVAVRDSRDPDGPAIDMSPRAWIEFTEHVKRATSGASRRRSSHLPLPVVRVTVTLRLHGVPAETYHRPQTSGDIAMRSDP